MNKRRIFNLMLRDGEKQYAISNLAETMKEKEKKKSNLRHESD
jgi:hypothetical protein